MTTRPRSAFAQAKEAAHTTLVAVARQLEAALARAQIPGTPEQAALSIRRGKREVETIVKRAMSLRTLNEPEPAAPAPTRQRADKSDIEPEIVYQGDNAVAVRHRATGPLQAVQQRWLIDPEQAMAGARFRRAFLDSRFTAATSNYSGIFTASNPTNRSPVPLGEHMRQLGWSNANGEGHSPLGSEEFTFAWARLEPDFKAVAWCLILEEPLPGEAHALSAAEFGRQIGKMRSEDQARWFAFGMLRATLVRLAMIRRHWVARTRVPQGKMVAAR